MQRLGMDSIPQCHQDLDHDLHESNWIYYGLACLRALSQTSNPSTLWHVFANVWLYTWLWTLKNLADIAHIHQHVIHQHQYLPQWGEWTAPRWSHRTKGSAMRNQVKCTLRIKAEYCWASLGSHYWKWLPLLNRHWPHSSTAAAGVQRFLTVLGQLEYSNDSILWCLVSPVNSNAAIRIETRVETTQLNTKSMTQALHVTPQCYRPGFLSKDSFANFLQPKFLTHAP